MARLRTLRPLALDSSHLGQFVRDLNSRRADERRRASEFERLLDAGGWVLALSHHHLAEIYTHADAAVRHERLAYIRSMPVVAYVRASGGLEAGPGSILDVLATEVAAALATGSTDTAAVAEAVRQMQESGVHPIAYLLRGLGLRPEELVEHATIEDLQRIAFHHHRASIAVAGSGLDPAVVRARVGAERLPSAVIGDAMARFGQQPRRRKGSVMNDVHLVCLTPYAQLTSVDKGTLANVVRASAACPVFESIVGLVARGRTYADLMPCLTTGAELDANAVLRRE